MDRRDDGNVVDSTLAQILTKLFETNAALNAALKELEDLKAKPE